MAVVTHGPGAISPHAPTGSVQGLSLPEPPHHRVVSWHSSYESSPTRSALCLGALTARLVPRGDGMKERLAAPA